MNDIRDGLFSEDEWEALHTEFGLPPRQREVIEHLFRGHSDKQIADHLGVALPTVRSHLRRIYTRFDVQDRTELVLKIFHVYMRSNQHAQEPHVNDDNYIDVI